MKPGDLIFFIENNRTICTGTILNFSGGLATIKIESGGAIRLKKHRLFESDEAIQKAYPTLLYAQHPKKKTIYDEGL